MLPCVMVAAALASGGWRGCGGGAGGAGGAGADAAPAAKVAPAPASPAPRAHDASMRVAVPAANTAGQDLQAVLLDAVRVATRRRAYGRAVERISTRLGSPISAAQALKDNPCGGWTGPECSNLTIGLEVAKACAPILARWHNKTAAQVAAVLADAVSAHSVWHDAYGYVREKLHKGPGYTYAGCLFSRCDPDSMYAGQIDGLLYQVGRLLGADSGPACGPACDLPPPAP